MSYRPLPPMMPISTFISLRLPDCLLQAAGYTACRLRACPSCEATRLRGRHWCRPRQITRSTFIRPSLSLRYPAVTTGSCSKNTRVLARDRFSEEGALELQRVHREQVCTHDPRERYMGDGRDQIGHERCGLPARLDQQHLVMPRVPARPAHADARRDFPVLLDQRQHPGFPAAARSSPRSSSPGCAHADATHRPTPRRGPRTARAGSGGARPHRSPAP